MDNMCYIAKSPCGCVRLYMVEEFAHSRDGRKSISEALKKGYSLERVPHETVKDMQTYCQACDPERVAKKQQMSLLAAAVEEVR